jgi:hypothetical protein
MVLATGSDVESICNADQLCSGVQAGIEGAIHAMGGLFDDKADEGWECSSWMPPTPSIL